MLDSEKSLLLWLRRVTGWTMILLAPVLILVACWGIHFDGWTASVSGLYWTNARPLFTGLISFLAIVEFCTVGYDWRDRVVSIICGICLSCTVLFPTFSQAVLGSDPVTNYDLFPAMNKQVSRWIHTISSMIMMPTFAINVGFIFTRHQGEITDKKALRNKIYKICALLVVIPYIIQTTWVLLSLFGVNVKLPSIAFYITEFIQFASCGFAYVVKSESLSIFND